jgi:hypothetical protein
MRLRLIAILLSFLFVLPAPASDKPSQEEVIAKSLQAFGSADLRAPAAGRELECRAVWRVIVGGTGALQGNCFLQTKADKIHLNMDFKNTTYPGEDIVYTGEGKPVVRHVTPGVRSELGTFLDANPSAVRSGLFGGVLTGAWPLFHFEKSGAKLISHGLKKVEGQKLYEFQYEGPKQADTKIFLYFDPETGRHIMTEYRALQPGASSNGIGQPSGRDEVTTLQEKFTEFHEINGMTLPLVWTIRFAQEQGHIQEWQMTFIKAKLTVPDNAFTPIP